MTQAPPPADLKLQRSSRDASHRPGTGSRAGWPVRCRPAPTEVTLHSGIDANGMSSETLVLDADLDRGRRAARRASTSPGSRRRRRTCRSSRTTRSRTSTTRCGSSASSPTCRCRRSRWMEPTGEVLGTPFFLMDRIDGRRPAGRAALQLRRQLAVRRVARGPAPAPGQHRRRCSPGCTRSRTPRRPSASSTARRTPGETPLARNLARTRAWYEFAVPDVGRSPLVERGARLARGQPARRRPATPCCAGATPGSAT